MLPVILIVVAAVAALGVVALVSIGGFASASENQSGAVDKRAVEPRVKVRVEEEDQAKQQLRERLIHAGLYRSNSAGYYYFTQLTIASIPLLLTLVGYRMGLMDFQMAVLLGLVAGILGVIGPGLWLDYVKSKRQMAIRRSLPDALDVITICVEAGLSLNSAIVRVSSELQSTYPLLASELIIVHRQVQMGKPAGAALRSFAERFDLAELRTMASVVSQSERLGASIASALRNFGETMRTKRMQQAEERAQKAAVKILMPTVLCIFPSLFVVILGPAYYDIKQMLENLNL